MELQRLAQFFTNYTFKGKIHPAPQVDLNITYVRSL